MLKVEGLHTYYGRAHILFDVAFEVAAGEVVVLLGRNGAGKSTTLKSIMGLVPPARGRIFFRNQDIAGWPPFQIARLGLGYVPEDRRIFAELTVQENLEVGRRERPAPAEAGGAGAPLWTPERLFALFPNLAGLRGRSAAQISGGEQRMLSIARTLMGNPSFLLLDEPSEGLAPLIVEQMASTILDLKRQGLTVLLSEQNLNFARAVADGALIIEEGRIRFAGSMAELMADAAVRAQYLSL